MTEPLTSVELFTGTGGLALGIAKAGFSHKALVELNRDACANVRANQAAGQPYMKNFPLFEGDVREFDFHTFGDVTLVGGGPPCQPFSLGGKHQGYQDERDMFPQAVRAVRELRPKAFVFENVKGLLRQSFATYFEYIILQLTHPDIVRKKTETWTDHCSRLERHHTSSKSESCYNVVFRLVNAADYGVPQRRERVFIVGFRSDLGVEWSFPQQSHARAGLLKSKLSGEYWDRHEIARERRPEMLEAEKRLAKSYNEAAKSWLTVRDALQDLPDPERETTSYPLNHVFVGGARSYAGHTGSPWDEPAKTLKAGNHGVPGGENMLLKDDGSVRYFTVRESARLQTFPDDCLFVGTWTEVMRQLGNAVPVTLAECMAKAIAVKLRGLH